MAMTANLACFPIPSRKTGGPSQQPAVIEINAAGPGRTISPAGKSYYAGVSDFVQGILRRAQGFRSKLYAPATGASTTSTARPDVSGLVYTWFASHSGGRIP